MWWRRADGVLVRGLPNTRRVMPYMMRGRNESAVYFEYGVSLVKADAFIRSWNDLNPMLRIDVFHLVVWAFRDAFERSPTVHRIIAGGRHYERKGIWFSYAVKTKLQTGAPFVLVKRRFDHDAAFGDMVEGIRAEEAKINERSTLDKELGLLMKFPGFVRRLIMGAIRLGDRLGMLPRGYIEKDPMYTSAFFANMASLGMPPVYHHLYEYGTATAFCSIGRSVGEPGSPTSGPGRRRVMTLKFTYDERADDGLAAWYVLRRIKQLLEDPEACGVVLEARAAGQSAMPELQSAVDETRAPVESKS
jgi:hypothetical protein